MVNGAEVPAYRFEPGVAPTRRRRPSSRSGQSRQLALGGSAVLSAHRQTPAEADDRDRHPVPPAAAADLQACQPDPLPADLLVINVQPDEGISLRFNAKIPSTRMQVAPVMMNFHYGTTFQGEVPEAYETLCSTRCWEIPRSSPVMTSWKPRGR